MSKYLGDFTAGDVIDFKFTTYRPSTGAPFTLAGSPVVSVYKDNSVTQSTTGVTVSVDFDSVTGLHNVNITTASDGTFYANGGEFECVITTGTVDSVSVVGSCVGRFTLGATAANVYNALVANYTLANSFGARLVRVRSTSPSNEVTITGSFHIAADVHEMQPAVIVAADFAAGAINANALATDAVNEIADGILLRSLTTAGAANNIAITSIVSSVFQATNTLALDDQVAFVGTAPVSFSLGAIYYVTSASLTSTTFTLASTLGGLAVSTSSTGAFTATEITDRNMLSALRYLRNKVDISGSTMTVYQEDDTTAAWNAALTTTAGVNPVTSVNPS